MRRELGPRRVRLLLSAHELSEREDVAPSGGVTPPQYEHVRREAHLVSCGHARQPNAHRRGLPQRELPPNSARNMRWLGGSVI